MSLTDDIIQSCPYCGKTGSLRELMSWEKDGKHGLLGKDAEGYIFFKCPECCQELRYDSESNTIAKPDLGTPSNRTIEIGLFVIALVIFLLVKLIF